MNDPIIEAIAGFLTEGHADETALERSRLVLADTMIAIISGRSLDAGAAAARFASRRPSGAALSFTGAEHLPPVDAAFCNGMLAHADETDDSHEEARMHPACSIVPAALAIGQAEGATYGATLEAIALGYDIGSTLNVATWRSPRALRASNLSTHHTGGLFGALAAGLRLSPCPASLAPAAFSYAVQHAGGATTWLRDTRHVEKAVVFGGLPARSALFCLELAQLGFSGVADPFSGSPSFFETFSDHSQPELVLTRLDRPGAAIQQTCIKRYPVGMPIQAACEAVETLLRSMGTVQQGTVFTSVLVELPAEKAHVVDNRPMADINCQHVVATQLVTGAVDFAELHDLREASPETASVRNIVQLRAAPDLDADRNGFGTTRIARVSVTVRGGETHEATVVHPMGSPTNPLGWDGLRLKAREVLGCLGMPRQTTDELVHHIRTSDTSKPVADIVETVAKLALHG